jgi:antitoxin component YwqK of YwqJK toxin-antitoxin module
MKLLQTIFILNFLFQFNCILAQEVETVYYDVSDKKVKKTHKADYYLKIKFQDNQWFAEKYSMGDVKISEGTYSDKKLTLKNGEFIHYYESGDIRLIENYRDNKLNGKSISYFQNGNIDYNVEYKNDNLNGTCMWYHENGQMSSKEEYVCNLRTSEMFWNEHGEEIDIKEAEYPPQFMGGIAELFDFWVNSKVKYPQDARELGYEGEQIISFVVDLNGMVTVDKVIQSVHPSIDKALIEIIESSPNWTPGKQHARLYSYNFDISTNFDIE